MRSVGFRSRLAAVAVAAAAALTPTSTQAALIVSSFESITCVGTSSTDDLDQGCPPLASALRDVSNGVTPATGSTSAGNYSANAFQSPFGYDRASADAAATLDVAAAAYASFGLYVRNAGASPVPLNFRFFISNAELALTIANYIAVAGDEPQAEIRSTVITSSLDGDSRQVHWRYRGVLTGTNSMNLVGLQDNLNFVDPQGIGKLDVDSIVQLGGSTLVDFEPFFGALDLGMLPPGESIRLDYIIEARVYTGVHDSTRPEFINPATVSVQALIEDPFSLDAGFFLNGQSLASLITGPQGPPPTGVPAPSVLFLLGNGLIAAGAWRLAGRKR